MKVWTEFKTGTDGHLYSVRYLLTDEERRHMHTVGLIGETFEVVSMKTAAARGVFNKPDAIRKSVLTVRARSRISDETVRAVREFQGSGRQAAAMAGISQTHAKNIRAGLARKDYSNPFSSLIGSKS